MIEAAEKTFSFGDFELSGAKRLLLKSGEAVALNSKTFDLLLTLVENHGQILSKDELLEKVWAGQFVEENNLTVQISALRKIFGESKNEHQFIATIPGKGYKFVAEISVPPNNNSRDLVVFAREKSETTLIGRTREIAEIKDLLRQDEVGLLTLTGAGGSGKTRLAKTIADEMQKEFADGIFFVELAAVNRAELVAGAIAQILDVKESVEKSLFESLKEFLHERTVLLILDNFEQIISAVPLIEELLDSTVKLKILITSRTLLHLKFEQEKVVLPLNTPPSNSKLSAEELGEFAAVELFAVRAQAAKPNFVLNNENAAVIAEICHKLDGLPLAIELAAVRVKLLSPQAISARLEKSLNLLTGGAKDLPVRQRTMRGAIEWSYELLDAEEKSLFRRLAIFAGGFTVEAAEFVGEEKIEGNLQSVSASVIDLITSLIDNNLLVTKEQPDGNVRLRMLEVVREFALELLQTSGKIDDLRQTHAQFFRLFAEEAESFLQGGRGNEWLEKLETEHDNLRSALSWSLKNDGDTAARIAAALRFFWLNHSHLSEGLGWSRAALAATENIVSKARSDLLLSNGVFLRTQGDFEAARKVYEKTLAESRETNDLLQIIKANHGLAAITVLQKDFASAQKFIEESLALSRQLKDETQIAYSLCSLGDLEMSRANLSAARPLLEECLIISKNLGNHKLLTTNYFNLGTIDYFENLYETAAFNFGESLRIAEEMGNLTMISCAFDGFAALAVKSGNPQQSAKFAGAAQGLREKIGYKIEPAEEIFLDKYLSETRAALAPQNFTDAYEIGRALESNKSIALTKAVNFNFFNDFNETTSEIIIETHQISRIVIEEEIEN